MFIVGAHDKSKELRPREAVHSKEHERYRQWDKRISLTNEKENEE